MAPVPDRANSIRPQHSEPGDAERVGHLGGVEAEQLADRDRAAERAGGAGRVEAALLVGVPGGAADPDHHLGAGDEGGEEVAAADSPRSCATARPAGSRIAPGCTPAPGLVEIVELEGVRERAVGEGRRRRLHQRAAEAEDAALAARAGAARLRDDHLAPRQVVAEHDGPDRVDDGVLARSTTSAGASS